MNAQELRKQVESFETANNIYMNFSVDTKGLWALPEGDRTQHLLTGERIEKYASFLETAIVHYANMVNFFTNDYDLSKKLKKYKLYLKRLNNALSKYNTIAENENTLTIEKVLESWNYDESEDNYWIDETTSHGTIMYLPEENIFIVNEGTENEYEASIEEVSSILK